LDAFDEDCGALKNDLCTGPEVADGTAKNLLEMLPHIFSPLNRNDFSYFPRRLSEHLHSKFSGSGLALFLLLLAQSMGWSQFIDHARSHQFPFQFREDRILVKP